MADAVGDQKTFYSGDNRTVRGRGPAKGLAWFMDSSIRLPGGFRIGADGILGLIPGVGDLIGALLSIGVLFQAWKRELPRSVMLRMLLNVLADTAIGAIPIVGDVFDFFWKSHTRNAMLLHDYSNRPKETRRRSVLVNLAALVVAIGILVLMVWMAIWFCSAVYAALFG